jgi:ketosteroid isomerase-like protein
LFDAPEEHRRGPLERFEKFALLGFAGAALIEILLGVVRAGSIVGSLLVALGILSCAGLWLLRARRMPGGGLAVPLGLLLATAGVYSGYTATNAPFVGVLGRFAVPAALVFAGAVLLFAEQDWQFQIVPFALAAIAFVVAQTVLTIEARSDGAPIPMRSSVSGGGGGIIGEMEILPIAQSFVAAINAHDAAEIVAMATPDHRFIDSLGHPVPADQLRAAWDGYFRMVPDYRIAVTRWIVDDDTVVAFGTASGTFTKDGRIHIENAWSTPAAWRALVRNGKIAEWQVYADNEPVRAVMRGKP